MHYSFDLTKDFWIFYTTISRSIKYSSFTYTTLGNGLDYLSHSLLFVYLFENELVDLPIGKSDCHIDIWKFSNQLIFLNFTVHWAHFYSLMFHRDFFLGVGNISRMLHTSYPKTYCFSFTLDVYLRETSMKL